MTTEDILKVRDQYTPSPTPICPICNEKMHYVLDVGPYEDDNIYVCLIDDEEHYQCANVVKERYIGDPKVVEICDWLLEILAIG